MWVILVDRTLNRHNRSFEEELKRNRPLKHLRFKIHMKITHLVLNIVTIKVVNTSLMPHLTFRTSDIIRYLAISVVG